MKIRDRPPDVSRSQTEQPFRRRCKTAQAEIHPHHHDGNGCSAQDVAEIVGRPVKLLIAMLQFVVDRREFLI